MTFARHPIARWLFTSHPTDSPRWECPGWFSSTRQCRKKAIDTIREQIPESVVPDFLSPEMVQHLTPLWEAIEKTLQKRFKKEKKHQPVYFGPQYHQAAALLGLRLEEVMGMSPSEAHAAIRNAYRALIQPCHPDLFAPQSSEYQAAHNRACEINQARTLLLSEI